MIKIYMLYSLHSLSTNISKHMGKMNFYRYIFFVYYLPIRKQACKQDRFLFRRFKVNRLAELVSLAKITMILGESTRYIIITKI
jgi:hypothetical protein